MNEHGNLEESGGGNTESGTGILPVTSAHRRDAGATKKEEDSARRSEDKNNPPATRRQAAASPTAGSPRGVPIGGSDKDNPPADAGGSDKSVNIERPWATRHRRAIIFTTIIVVAVAGFAYWLVRRKETAADATGESAVVVSVRVAKAERKTIAAQVSAVGTVFPRQQSTVSAKIGAPISHMGLLKNKPVRAGDIIAVLESKDLSAQRGEAAAALAQAQANSYSLTSGTIPQTNAQDEKALRDARATAASARATFDRRKVLYDKGAISKKDLEASQLALTTAEDDLRLAERTTTLRATAINPSQRQLASSQINQAQQHLGTLDAQLSYATIRAPISGIVTDQFQFQGEYAAPGAKLVTISDISEVIVKANFSDTVASQLKVGEPARVVPTDSAGDEMSGQITLVSRASDPVNRTVEVWVNLANGAGRLRADGAAQVTISTIQVENAVVVPAVAVTLDASNADAGTVMVVDALSVARETKVTVGIRSGNQIEIKSGLEGGEQVVIEGNYALPDGTKVQATEAAAGESGTAGDEGGGGAGKGDEP